MSRPAYLTIDLAALKHNLARVREIAKGCSVIAMLKANAYGHGMVPVAHALSGADALGVASIDEALTLRAAGIMQPIVLMEGLFYPDELAEAVKHQFSLIVHHLPQVEMLEKADIASPIFTWLKINTGMHRLGFNPNDVSAIYQRLQVLDAVKKPIGLMTHFAEADSVNSAATEQQIEAFNQVTKTFAGPRSLANSAGIISWPKTHADWVRPGLMLYGASPFANQTGLDHQLRPVMTLRSCLIAISHIKKGGKVGYGGTWVAPDDTNVGVVGVGYGDGYPQSAQNGTPVLVNGKVCKLVGRVSMDMLTVDLGADHQAKIGDPVILWGEGLPVEWVAKHNHTSAYEMLTRMTSRPKVEIRR